MPDGSVCNPAFLPYLTDNLFMGRVFIGNGYTALSSADKFIFKPISREFLQDLFSNQNVTSVEAHAGLLFATQNFNAGFSPYRVQYVSEVHNPNFPVIAIHAAIEQSFYLGTGFELGDLSPKLKEWSVGLKARFLKRNYVHGSFSMFQAVTDEPRNLLPAKEQTALLIDPAIAWSRKTKGGPRYSATASVSNLGQHWPVDPLYPDPVSLNLGTGAEIPLPLGRARAGLDITGINSSGNVWDTLHFGGAYLLGITQIMAGANSHSLTAGAAFGFQLLQASVIYEFIRDDFSETAVSSRISTEFTVRL